ncbi:mannitol dehydrogenase family protein [Microbacterium lacus]|uniref:mannitol dehydrogenase family protein n=1 Tax=Microbacterium lacus TaxID=415217 RepID=UPI003850F2AE
MTESIGGHLRRTELAPPVRIVHLGLGAFSRSHSAWYTEHASDAHEWGIAAYTGSSVELAQALEAQDGLYTLVTRSVSGDEAEVIGSIVRAEPGGNLPALLTDLAAPGTAIVTLTITEAGYRADRHGELDLSDPLVAADRETLSAVSLNSALGATTMRTALGRLVLGLEARRRAGGGPIAIVSCDNLPDNGGLLRACVLGFAAANFETHEWCEANVSFVSSSVDRITPAISSDELAAFRDRFHDRAPVVTEPFADWVLSGAFPAGRPRWETAGARFTDELEPWEARKLWMLNGAHTILASLGPFYGHADVAQAIADPVCREAVEAFWDEAGRHLPEDLDLPQYRTSLLERFSNPRIVHLLSQISLDATTKVRLRIAPVATLERSAYRSAEASALAIAAWLATEPPEQGSVALRDRVHRVSAALASDDPFLELVEGALNGLLAVASV